MHVTPSLAPPPVPATPPALRVVVVDDHPVVCDGVALLLSRTSAATVVGTASSGEQAVEVVVRERPDVVLLDLRMPGSDAAVVVGRLLRACPTAKVLLFTAHAEPVPLKESLAAGASGCLLKDVGSDELLEGLRAVVVGRHVLDPRLATRPDLALLPRLEALGMTRREFECVRLVAHGMTNPEIAEEMGLTRNTVKTYLQSCMQKLGARNRVDAIAKARAARLL